MVPPMEDIGNNNSTGTASPTDVGCGGVFICDGLGGAGKTYGIVFTEVVLAGVRQRHGRAGDVQEGFPLVGFNTCRRRHSFPEH